MNQENADITAENLNQEDFQESQNTSEDQMEEYSQFPVEEKIVQKTRRLTQSELEMLRQDVQNQEEAYRQAENAAQEAVEAEEKKIISDILQRGRARVSSKQRTSLENSPWDNDLKALLQHLPSINESISEEDLIADKEKLASGEYDIREVTARGAESVLYKASQGDSIFCVKAIRNWKDMIIGDPKNRDQKPLLKNVNYRTKCRHLKNEFAVSKRLSEGIAIDHSAVKIYLLRRREKWGFEIGYDLLMEFVNGYNFSQRQLLHSLSFEDKVRTCFWMACSLSGIHNHGIVHLDIKPSNFMIDVSGRVRIIDFGVSVPNRTKNKAITGTVGFLSPEQIGRTYVDIQTDIFALGVVYSMIFGGKQLPQTIEECSRSQARREALMSLEKIEESLITDIPELNEFPELASIIRQCGIPCRKKRISNCEQLMMAFRQFGENHGIALDW